MEPTFWNSQPLGIIIGAGIAGVFNVFAQVFAHWRQKSQFAYDLEARQQQFAHEKEQEVRGRRTAALDDCRIRLDRQEVALRNVWGYLCHPEPPYDKNSAEEGWEVLNRGDHRSIPWPLEDHARDSIIEYDGELITLLTFVQSPLLYRQSADKHGVLGTLTQV